jgi:ATP-dependent DNA helicase RecG
MLRLDTEVQYVKGVGPRRAALLTSRGVRSVGDLLLRIPKAYQDRSSFISLSSLRAGQDAAIQAKIYRSRDIKTRTRGRILEVVLTDGTSFAYAKWFHGGSLRIAKGFGAGKQIVLYGRVERDSYEGKLAFFNPEFELLDDEESAPGAVSLDVGRIVPVYEELAGNCDASSRLLSQTLPIRFGTPCRKPYARNKASPICAHAFSGFTSRFPERTSTN